MIAEDIYPFCVRIAPANEHALSTWATIADKTSQAGVIGVAVAHEPCLIISHRDKDTRAMQHEPTQFRLSK